MDDVVVMANKLSVVITNRMAIVGCTKDSKSVAILNVDHHGNGFIDERLKRRDYAVGWDFDPKDFPEIEKFTFYFNQEYTG